MSGNIKLNTPSNGSVTLSTPDTASAVTVTIPATTDTLVNLTSSQTMTNKTLTSPTITGATLSGSISGGTFSNTSITAANSNTVEATSGPTSTQLAGMRNKIINGAMMIDQRNAGASKTVDTDPIYGIDRFCGGKGGNVNNFTMQQSTTVPSTSGFVNSLLVTMGTGVTINAGAYAYLAQFIEGLNTADLGLGTANASPFTVSFWVRCSVTGTFGVSFRNNAATATYSATYTINAANTWEYKTVTVPAITSGTWLTTTLVGVGIMWDLGVGSTYSATAGQLNTGANYFGVTGTTKLANTSGATWYVTGVQLEKGATATPFENRLYGTELALCQRYYFRMLGNGSANAQYMVGVMGTTSAAYYCTSVLPVIMRASPTSSYSGIRIWSSGTATAVTSITNTNSNTTNASLWFSSGGTFTTNSIALIVGSAGSTDYLDFSAEL